MRWPATTPTRGQWYVETVPAAATNGVASTIILILLRCEGFRDFVKFKEIHVNNFNISTTLDSAIKDVISIVQKLNLEGYLPDEKKDDPDAKCAVCDEPALVDDYLCSEHRATRLPIAANA